ncbi:MAG: nuclear transport factor 2 family protein [Nitriliruptorales bacterium]|nr:nuclear transport factor 2 family protein [Nitriliruptorales bacterium]
MPTDVVRRLYDAFLARDGQAMEDCYAADATFRDEVFDLTGREEIGGMWKMLIARGTDLELTVSDVVEDQATGSAHWEPTYTFGATGRKVHNIIDATMRIEDGLIVEHVDRFNFWRWSRQAFGPVGWTLGWTPAVRTKVRIEARKSLDKWLAGDG